VQATDLPVSVDFEGGYAESPDAVGRNILPILEAGAIGINFEDRIVGGKGLHALEAQVARLQALRNAAEAAGAPLFINARTDLFLGSDPASHADFVAEARERALAYADAGADGFFVPGLRDLALIAELAEAQALPLNVMRAGDDPIAALAGAGVARISHGPAPYRDAMRDLKEKAEALFGKTG
jgi:2-methylisocitrate lyase-like PEP mutase family enzyme